MKQVLVTGGAGYIGSHLCKSLASSGFKPIVFDDLSAGKRERVLWGPLEEGSLLDKDRLRDVFKTYKIEGVFHLAALISVADSVKQPDAYYNVNLVGSLNLLEVMLEFQVMNIIFSSSASVFGSTDVTSLTEQDLPHPINPYGRTKLMFEEVLQDFFEAYQINSVSLRYFNASGASFDEDIGSDCVKPSHLIPRILNVALGREPFLEIYGTDYPTPDGTAIRDFVHVVDLARAHLSAFEYCQSQGGALVCHLGSGQGYSVKQVIEAVTSTTGKRIQIKERSRRIGDPAIIIANSSLANQLLQWKVQFSDLATIIETAWNWQKKH